VRRGALVACAFALFATFARDARAQQCGRPDVLDTVPPDQAIDVPPNASLTAHYDPSAEYLGEDVVLTPMGGVDEVVEAAFDDTQGLLTYAPPAPLAPGDYVITWPSLRGLNAAALGTEAVVHFTVGTTDDTTPPVFDGLTGVTWDLERKNNTCTKSIEDRMVFELSLAPAADDGGRDGLRLVIFQTSGSGVDVDAGSVPVQTMAMPAVGKTAEVKLPVSDATGHVCFAAIARDLTGKISNGGSHAACVDTIAPPFFRGCAVATGASRADRGVGLVLLAAGLALARRRRRAR
jgi:MYXO-CTERM domain-containing protein